MNQESVDSRTTASTPPLLVIRGITKTFGAVHALKDVNFTVGAGEIVVLLGENGAGKSTLLKTITGVHAPDAGGITWQGAPVTLDTPAKASSLGIRMVYQELPLAPHLTVAQSICLGNEPTRGFGLLNHRAERTRAQAVLQKHNFDLDPDARVGDLSPAARQLVEISKALAAEARLLLLDEPTASLGEREIADLFTTLRHLRSQGIGIVYVSHRLPECFAIGDRIVVLRDGQNVYDAPIPETDAATVVRHMVGRDLEHFYPRSEITPGAVRLQVQNLSIAPNVRDVSLTLRAGEVVGIAGLMGAGRSALLSALFGLRSATGTVTLDGKPLPLGQGPKAAIRAGIGFVTEDRKRTGLALGLGVRHNLTLSALDKVTPGPWLSPGGDVKAATSLVSDGKIKTASTETLAGSLSGGNQQKIVMGRWLWADSSVLLLDEPTRGVDVASKVELYERINRATQAGACVLLVSSELPELLGMSDRILVLHGGRIIAEVPRSRASASQILHLAMTGQEEGAMNAQ